MTDKKTKELSFEESLANLEEIVKKLESGDVPLDLAIDEFNKAMVLAKSCEKDHVSRFPKAEGDIFPKLSVKH